MRGTVNKNFLFLHKGSEPETSTFFDGIPDEWSYAVSESGFINGSIFVNWLEKTFIPNCGRKRPVILTMDNSSTHISIAAIDMCIQHQVELYCYPSLASHLVQPNDQFFNVVKNATSEIAHNLGFLDPDFCVNKDKFAKVYYYGEKKALTEKNVKSAWAKSGSWPIGIDRLSKEYIIEAEEDHALDMRAAVLGMKKSLFPISIQPKQF